MKRHLIGLALLALAACSGETSEPTATTGPTPSQYAGLAALAINAVKDACPGLVKYHPGVTVAGVTGNENDGFEIQFLVHDASEIPSNRKVFAGENCYYRTGGPLDGGINTAKRACIALCTDTPFTGEATMDYKIK